MAPSRLQQAPKSFELFSVKVAKPGTLISTAEGTHNVSDVKMAKKLSSKK
jgi:hypothetical protein